ncbi:hypothetical protein JYB88_12665 [Shewanella cyperi]|uniref:Uncharacterized protein n=1 Tax=Shewanella cyperi TaxID=2814292 RepID=A0A974XIM3_9GAMM|nr:hypothetical protein [Shewanella cyperi]QSX29090.1 hypothetical protein JYB88_12665 [Shewanella cyperi]
MTTQSKAPTASGLFCFSVLSIITVITVHLSMRLASPIPCFFLFPFNTIGHLIKGIYTGPKKRNGKMPVCRHFIPNVKSKIQGSSRPAPVLDFSVGRYHLGFAYGYNGPQIFVGSPGTWLRLVIQANS